MAGCAKSPPTLIDRLDDPQMGREELRVRLYQYVRRFTSETEVAVYEIIDESKDLRMGRNALLWATSVVPAVQSAAFQPDPASGLVDAWALAAQQRDFFKTGVAKDAFGEYQYIPIAASVTMLDQIEVIARDLSPNDFDRLKQRIEAWVAENPIDNYLFNRQSTAPLTAASLGAPSSSALSAVGNMSDEVRDLSARLSVYNEVIPRMARWQAALLLTAEAGGVSFTEMLRDIEVHARGMQDIVVFLDSLQVFLDSLPALITDERTAVLNDITRERIVVMREISDLLDVALDAINEQRQAVMNDVAEERVAATEDIDAIATRLAELALEDLEVRLEETVDHLIWRIIQVLAVLIVLAAIAGFFIVRFFSSRTRSA
jgi:hypothetical protein